MFVELIDKIIDEYKKDPRNKIFITGDILLTSAKEETGKEISIDQLRSAKKISCLAKWKITIIPFMAVLSMHVRLLQITALVIPKNMKMMTLTG